MTTKRIRNPMGASTRCTAVSKRSGEPCGNWALVGDTKCRMHVGKTVADSREASRMRLLEAADPAAAVLVKLALNLDGNVPHNIQLAAARDILDRNGIGDTQQIEVLLKPWEINIEGILIDDDDDVVEGEIVEPNELGRLVPPADISWSEERLPALADDPPRYGRGNRVRGR